MPAYHVLWVFRAAAAAYYRQALRLLPSLGNVSCHQAHLHRTFNRLLQFAARTCSNVPVAVAAAQPAGCVGHLHRRRVCGAVQLLPCDLPAAGDRTLPHCTHLWPPTAAETVLPAAADLTAACWQPFATARDNLKLLLSKNKERMANMGANYKPNSRANQNQTVLRRFQVRPPPPPPRSPYQPRSWETGARE